MTEFHNKEFFKMNNKQGNLIFEYKGRTEVIKHDLPFALLNYLKKKLQNDAQYAGGTLKIVANYEKEVKTKEITISKYDDFLRNT